MPLFIELAPVLDYSERVGAAVKQAFEDRPIVQGMLDVREFAKAIPDEAIVNAFIKKMNSQLDEADKVLKRNFDDSNTVLFLSVIIDDNDRSRVNKIMNQVSRYYADKNYLVFHCEHTIPEMLELIVDKNAADIEYSALANQEKLKKFINDNISIINHLMKTSYINSEYLRSNNIITNSYLKKNKINLPESNPNLPSSSTGIFSELTGKNTNDLMHMAHIVLAIFVLTKTITWICRTARPENKATKLKNKKAN